MALDPLLDITFNCEGYDAQGNYGKGILYASASLSAEVTGLDYLSTLSANATLSGISIAGNVVTADVLTAYAMLKGIVYLIPSQVSWVWTTKVGAVDFTVDKTQEVSSRPMPWDGWTYKIKKFGNSAIVYCQNGIAVMTPHGVLWELKTLMNVGLKSKNSVCGTDDTHFFVDKTGILYKMDMNGIEVHDYSNFLSTLTSATVMSYDPRLKTVHITDGVLGFIFSASGLGKGPINITGIGYKVGTFYITAPGTITTDPLQICTDIIDLGTRGVKTIYEIDIGIALTKPLYVAVDYRWNKGQDFFTTPWTLVDFSSRANITASGIEFRIRAKVLEYEVIQIDYMNIRYLETENMVDA